MLTPSRTTTLLAILFCFTLLLAVGSPTPPALIAGSIEPTAVEKESVKASLPQKADPAADKFWQALKLLKSTKPADLALGRAALQAASDLEFAHAQVLLGNCLLSGNYGFPNGAGTIRRGQGISGESDRAAEEKARPQSECS